ncbi:hypothetical protein Holit_02678 [Hollandina sp. SP2]
MAYDVVFRKRVIKDAGHTVKDVHETFGIDSKRYYSWKEQLEQTGFLEKKSPKEGNGKLNKSEVARLFEEHPGWYVRAFEEKITICPLIVLSKKDKIALTLSGKTLTNRQIL